MSGGCSVELMGRYTGWIALHAGIAGGADVILIPEIPYDLAKVAELILARERLGARFSIVAAAEGARPVGDHDPVMGFGGRVESVDRFGGEAHRRVETERARGPGDVVVDGLGTPISGMPRRCFDDGPDYGVETRRVTAAGQKSESHADDRARAGPWPGSRTGISIGDPPATASRHSSKGTSAAMIVAVGRHERRGEIREGPGYPAAEPRKPAETPWIVVAAAVWHLLRQM